MPSFLSPLGSIGCRGILLLCGYLDHKCFYEDVEEADKVANMGGPHNDKQPTTAEPSATKSAVADDVEAPDPDEDDLDDLDGVVSLNVNAL